MILQEQFATKYVYIRLFFKHVQALLNSILIKGPYPLLNAIKSNLFSGGFVPTSSSSKTTNKPTSQFVTNSQTFSYSSSSVTYSFSSPSNYPIPISKCSNGDGIYPDLDSGCTKFYQCSFTGTSNEIVQTFICPALTLYDPLIKSCNFAPSVKCGYNPSSSTHQSVTQVTQVNVFTSSNSVLKCTNGDGKNQMNVLIFDLMLT